MKIRHASAAFCFLLLMILAGVLLWNSSPALTTTSSVDSANWPVESARPDRQNHVAVAPQQPTDAGKGESFPPAMPASCQLTLHFTDAGGTAVSGIPFRYWRASAKDSFLRRSKTQAPAKPDSQVPDAADAGTSNSDGLFEITCKPDEMFSLFIADNRFCLGAVSSRRTFARERELRFLSFNLNGKSSHTERIVLARCVDVTLAVQYEDGRPFRGSVAILVKKGDDASPLFLQKTEIADASILMVESVPADAKIQISANTVDPGFQQQVTFDFEIFRDGTQLLAVIPKAKTLQQGIIVDLASLPDGKSVELQILSPVGGIVEKATIVAPIRYRSRSLSVFKEFEVVITGDLAWASGGLAVPPGEYVEVVPKLEQPATVIARVLDSEGKPLCPAVLNRNTARYPHWPLIGRGKSARCVQGLYAIADGDGKVALSGLAPGRFEVSIEAPGFEVAKREVCTSGGQTTDLGDIRLGPATAKVVVRLQNASPAKPYRVIIMQPAGMPAIRPVPFVDGVARIANIPARKYEIFVFIEPGGAGWSKVVEFSAATEAVEVNFDVSTPPGPIK